MSQLWCNAVAVLLCLLNLGAASTCSAVLARCQPLAGKAAATRRVAGQGEKAAGRLLGQAAVGIVGPAGGAS